MANHIYVVKANVYLPNDVIMTLKTTFNDVFKISRTVFLFFKFSFLLKTIKNGRIFLHHHRPPPTAKFLTNIPT